MIYSPSIYGLNFVDSFKDIELTHLNLYNTKSYYPVHSKYHSYFALSDILKIKSYVYDEGLPESNYVIFKAHVSGECHGILSFFDAYYGKYVIGNNPFIPSHWHQAFHPLEFPVKLIAGIDYRFILKFNGQIEFKGEV